ncbi:MAG: Aldehyde dehydrogenase [uncultured Pseudonocardia sp.]|uniref:Aldehyde dehydrogenase n=1 Tax=uncultured Pseudonocardia sp. TaxID=211455 RepID=A0A6J4NHB4_9PSEU|nr:MAG: Aldehyde dehydrogenase [uncultured Pseudonocardia sp.]
MRCPALPVSVDGRDPPERAPGTGHAVAGAPYPGPVTLSPAVDGRLPVAKTFKLFVAGAFPRSESGRSYPVTDAAGQLLAHAALASRKDVRDAVAAAKAAGAGWAGATAYNRGQVLYRVAELLQARHEQFTDDVAAAEGLPRAEAAALVDAAIDRWVWYAGWTDKLAPVLGSVNPVAGPLVSWSAPEPTGVVGVLAPQASSLLGLVDVLAPVLATGCTAVVVTSRERPLPAVGLAEVLATSDVPGGVANVLTGDAGELAPWLAAHADVAGLDLAGCPQEIAADCERAAAGSVTRVLPRPAAEADHTRVPGLARLRAWTEIKTVWHPVGR